MSKNIDRAKRIIRALLKTIISFFPNSAIVIIVTDPSAKEVHSVIATNIAEKKAIQELLTMTASSIEAANSSVFLQERRN